MNAAGPIPRLARLGSIVLLGGIALHAPAPAAGSTAAVREFDSSLPSGAAMVTSPDARAIEALRGLAIPVGRGDAAGDGTRRWVMALAPAFGLDPSTDDVIEDRVESLPGGRARVTLRQRWRGLPVSGADARAVVSATGELTAIASAFRAVSADASTPSVTRESAVAAAATAVGADLAHVSAAGRLVIRTIAGRDRLVWEVSLERSLGGSVLVWVGATEGRVLEVDDGVARAVGFAYPTDPRGPVSEVRLDRLLPAIGLASRSLGIEDQTGPKVVPLAPDDYRYPPETPGFDQVNAYWHADRFLHDYLGSLGYAGPPESLIVRVHAPLEHNVAVTSGRFVLLGLAIPGFTRDAARGHDIIYHELVHAVMYGKDIQPGGLHREASALHEGLADYFAAATTGDPSLGEWVYLLFPNGATRVDMPVDPWNHAHYDQLSFASAPPSSPWANGMILSSALWDLRASLGTACDSLVLESLDYLPTVPTWAHFANAMLQADDELHAGRFGAAIVSALSRRGIRGAAVAEFSGPTQLPPGGEGEFRAEPCCGEVFGEYRWLARPMCRGTPCGDWRMLGEGRTLRVGFGEESTLELHVQTPWGDTLRKSRRIALRSPTLHLDGPSRIVKRASGTWTVKAVAAAPWRITWERQWLRPNAFYLVIGDGTEQTFAADTSFLLRVTLRDGLARTVVQTLRVDTYTDKPPPLITGVFKVEVVVPMGARFGEVRYELLTSATLQIHVLDVSGRLRAVLADGPVSRGTRVLRFDAGALEPGVYLLRFQHGAERAVRRFVVVR